MGTTTHGYGRALGALWSAPSAVGYALAGGVASIAALSALFGAAPLVAWAFGYGMADVAAGTRLRTVPILPLTFAYAAGALVVTTCVWTPFEAAIAHAVGSSLRGDDGDDASREGATVFAVGVAWRPLLVWATLRALSSGFLARLFPPLARAVRRRFVPPDGRSNWRRTTAFLTPAIVLERPADLEGAIETSRRRASATDSVSRIFVSAVAVGCVLGLLAMTAALLAYASTGATAFGYLAAYAGASSVVFGVVGAATLETALRTRQYVDLDGTDAGDERDRRAREAAGAEPARVD